MVDKEVIQILKQRFPYAISAQLFNRQIKQICQIAGINNMVSGYKLCPKTRRKRLGTHPKYSLISSHDLRRSLQRITLVKLKRPYLCKLLGTQKKVLF